MQMSEHIGLFTGTFDPITNGHVDIIERASKLFDKLYVGIFKNDRKNPMFMTDKRREIMEEALKHLDNIEIVVHEHDLTVNIAKKLGVTALVRSVRNATDLEYESNMIYFNRQMTGIETILLVSKPELEMIASSRIKELYNYGADYSAYVPKNVFLEMERARGSIKSL
jgi:pantetheine-phosphate adenylyltransferase